MNVKIMANRFYLDVPYADKDDAKAKGAWWDNQVRKWYVPDGVDTELFRKWFQGENPDYVEPEVVAEEDRCYLDVDFAEREAVKKLGARWCPQKKKWWAMKEDKDKFGNYCHELTLSVVENDNCPL